MHTNSEQFIDYINSEIKRFKLLNKENTNKVIVKEKLSFKEVLENLDK